MRVTFFRNARGVLMVALEPDPLTTVTRPATDQDKQIYQPAWERFKAAHEKELTKAASEPVAPERKRRRRA